MSFSSRPLCWPWHHRLWHFYHLPLSWFGTQGCGLNCSQFYLSSRSLRVKCDSALSSFYTFSCGVPQSSVPCPPFFSSTLFHFLESSLLCRYDTQLFSYWFLHQSPAKYISQTFTRLQIFYSKLSKSEILLNGLKNNFPWYVTHHSTASTLLATTDSSLNICLFSDQILSLSKSHSWTSLIRPYLDCCRLHRAG